MNHLMVKGKKRSTLVERRHLVSGRTFQEAQQRMLQLFSDMLCEGDCDLSDIKSSCVV